MASNRRFTVEEALDTIFGDSDSEMEEEASGSESESASDTEINMESASEGKWRIALMISTQTCQPTRKICSEHEELDVVSLVSEK